MNNIDEARDAMEVLRKFRNNMSKDEYCSMILYLLRENTNLIEPTVLAGYVAKEQMEYRMSMVPYIPDIHCSHKD